MVAKTINFTSDKFHHRTNSLPLPRKNFTKKWARKKQKIHSTLEGVVRLRGKSLRILETWKPSIQKRVHRSPRKRHYGVVDQISPGAIAGWRRNFVQLGKSAGKQIENGFLRASRCSLQRRTKAFTSLFAAGCYPAAIFQAFRGMKLAGVFRGTPIRARHASVCAYKRVIHVQKATSTQVTCLVPTHGQLLLSPFSLSVLLQPCPFCRLQKDMVGGPKGISLAKYVSTCFHILDLYVEYSRRSVVGQRTGLEDVAWSSTRKESNEFYIHEFLNHESCSLVFVNFKTVLFFPFRFFLSLSLLRE